MLINCPECNLQVSDKTIACPHCGYPLKPLSTVNINKTRSRKRKRLPNGFGQITELKNRNLRKPFRAMVTVGKDAHGRPICKLLKPDSYFETYNDAYKALLEYNNHPYDIQTNITMSELYERFAKEHAPKVANITMKQLDITWRYCNMIYDVKVSAIRTKHLRTCIEQGSYVLNGVKHNTTPIIKDKIKSLFNQLFDYAVEHELVDRNYSRDMKISIERSEVTHHSPYTQKELDILWEHTDEMITRAILIQCYSGWRPQELVNIKLEDVDLENRTFKGGLKTTAGKNRVVPIHSKIYPFVEQFYNESKKFNCTHLISYDGNDMNYDKLRNHFNKLRKIIGNNNRKMHDGRNTFITNAKRAGIDEYAIKTIVGHHISDITESVYTFRDLKWLSEEIEKIK